MEGTAAGTCDADEDKFASTVIVCESVFAGVVDGTIAARVGLNASTGAVSRGADNAGMSAAVLGSIADSVTAFASTTGVLAGVGGAPTVCGAITATASVHTFISRAADAMAPVTCIDPKQFMGL